MKLFISYAREDLDDLNALLPYLTGTEGVDTIFWDEHLRAGDVWKQKLETELLSSDFLLFLVSPHSIISEMAIWEFDTFQRRQKRIIPVYLESIDYADDSRFERLNSLPLDARRRLKPVDQWEKPTRAYQAIASELKKAIQKEHQHQQEVIDQARAQTKDQFSDFQQVLERYLNYFGWSVPEVELEERTYNNRTFKYFSKRLNIAFEPMKGVDDPEVVRLRVNDFVEPLQDADFRIFFIPYNLREETLQGAQVFDNEKDLLYAISRHIDELECVIRVQDKNGLIHIPRIDEIYLGDAQFVQ